MRRFFLLLFLLASVATPSRGQEPFDYPSGMFAELPHERAKLYEGFTGIDFPVTTSDAIAKQFFQQGLAELSAGTNFEAARAFREVITRDPDCAMGYWGIAMAFRSDISMATEYMWHAYERRASASDFEKRFIENYAAYYGADKKPEMVLLDPETGKRRAKPTVRSPAEELAAKAKLHRAIERQNAKTGGIKLKLQDDVFYPVTADPFFLRTTAWRDGLQYRMFRNVWTSRLQSIQPANADPQEQFTPDVLLTCEAQCRADNNWLIKHAAMPYEVVGYGKRLSRLLSTSMPRSEVKQALESLPRHPARTLSVVSGSKLLADWRENVTATAEEVAEIEGLGPLNWTPPNAPAFALAKGKTDGVMSLDDLDGPTIVVFYLGFGCIHCVEQLNELRPRYKDFKAAGIEIVAIGTDKVDDVKAAILDTIEVDGPQTPFEILCDPESETFKAFHCWDQFTDEPLHGTFLIDAKGRIRWRDISEEPFMETDFLLEEAKRMTAFEN